MTEILKGLTLVTSAHQRARELMLLHGKTAAQAVEQVFAERASKAWREPVVSRCNASRAGLDNHRRALQRRGMIDKLGIAPLRKYSTIEQIMNAVNRKFR